MEALEVAQRGPRRVRLLPVAGGVLVRLGELSAVKQAEFERWTREQQVAFLINAYNAFTVQKVLTRYPDLKSIRDFGKIFGNPFKHHGAL